MKELVNQMAYSQPALLVIGAILLLFGRKLYWLALAIVGALLGLTLAHQSLGLSGEMAWGVAALAGIAAAIFAYVAKKLAVTLGGLGLGGIVTYYLAAPFAEQLQYQIWWVVLLGAVLGLCFAAFVFEFALLVTSAVVGAMLVAQGLVLDGVQETAVFLVLVVVGMVVQTRSKKAPDAD